jgi:beta-glucosidase
MKLIALFLLMLAIPLSFAQGNDNSKKQAVLSHRTAPILIVDGLQFKDLNRNGKLDRYEDWRLPAEERAQDLLQKMTLDEMAGLMVHGTLPTAGGGVTIGPTGYDQAKASSFIKDSHVNAFITRLSGAASFVAEQNNQIQALAESTRLGIPVTISTDPRNHFQYTRGASVQAGSFSKWPELVGFAAIGDESEVRKFADIARQEYIAVGIRETLSPQADLATEPRWARINGTFGEDAESAKRLIKAYVEGFQAGDSGLNPRSVLVIVKHWVGYGAQKDGWDSHNYYGRFAAFPGGNFAYHIIPFTGAFAANVAGVMPTYSILENVSIDGKPLEQVGAAFNAQLLTTLLRGKYGFKGVVLSDWGITNDCLEHCRNGFPAGVKPDFSELVNRKSGMPWGVEDLSREDRFAKAINAGVDQIGDSEEPEFIVNAVHEGKIAEARVRDAAFRILVQKFAIGLFEDPFANPDHANAIVGNADFLEQGKIAQRRALVLLENKGHLLPLKTTKQKVFLYDVNPAVATRFGFDVVDSPDKADIAIIRAAAPYQSEHPTYIFASHQSEGRLDFRESDPAYAAFLQASAKVPTIMTITLNRPAILTNVKDKATALIGDFGIEDEALMDVICGKAKPEGHLPFELPSSAEAVKLQRSDVPHDSPNPLYQYGFGRSY